MAILTCFGGFVLVSMGMILYVARREDCVFYCKQSKIIEYYETDFRVSSFEATVYTRRYIKVLNRIKRYANEDFQRKQKNNFNNKNQTYFHAKSYN